MLNEFNKIISKFRREYILKKIYSKGLWGKQAGNRFYSGVGSRGENAKFYTDNIVKYLEKDIESFKELTVIDIGCGDFQIGRKIAEKLNKIEYIGCDIVDELIKHNTRENTLQNVSFRHLDAITDELPNGEICLIRQVLQHMSNKDIIKVLDKLKKYKIVYITEGQPVNKTGPINPDKTTGAGVRFDWRTGSGRGVELDKEPFNININELFKVCTDQKEEIVTYIYTPNQIKHHIS